ncbi:MAG: restriction endonuclease subunit S [Flavobacteriales bacterium]
MEELLEKTRVLPKGWRSVHLGDVLSDIIGGGTPSRDVDHYWNGDIPWITVKDMRTRRPEAIQEHITEAGVNECATNIIPADTVITATRVGLGKVVRVPYPAAINQDLKALIVGPDLEKDYLEWWIISQANYIESIGSGTTVKGIRLNQLKELEIPLAPLPQQRRIVEAIELQQGRLDAAVARLQGAKARLKRYKQAVLKAAFAETESGFDEGWQELTIGDIARRIVVGYVGPMTEFIVERDGIPLLSTTHIGENEFLDKESRQVTRAFHEKNKKSRVAPGDILIARHGDSGKACIVPGHLVEAQVSNAVILSVDSASALPEYVCYRINFERTVMQEARVGGVLQVVNTKTMEAFPLRVPSLESQRRIVERIKQQLTATDETETTLDAQLQQAVRLRQAVLKRAFEGRLG